MSHATQSSIWLSLLALSGCFHTLPSVPEAENSDASDGDHYQVGDIDAELLPGLDDAGAAPTYLWRIDAPADGQEEGPFSFALACYDPQGNRGDCSFVVKLDDAPPMLIDGPTFEADWLSADGRFAVYPHVLCVQTSVPYAAGQGGDQCVSWHAAPHRTPYVWLARTPATDVTMGAVPLRCAQRTAEGELGDETPGCTYRCSLDGAPYAPCTDPYTYAGVAPGAHTLRVETRGPEDTPLSHVAHVESVAFTIAQDAQPTVLDPIVDLPGVLSEERLEALGLADLITAYGTYAARCAPGGTGDDADRLRRLLSYAFARPGSSPLGFQTFACADLLAEPNLACPRPSARRYAVDIGALRVPLPLGCEQLTWSNPPGPSQAGQPCLTSSDCNAMHCEYAAPWTADAPVFGTCAMDDVEYREGIACLARGCGDGLYCDGRACRRVHAPDEPCDARYTGLDCREGETCREGVCAAAEAELLSSCTVDRDCRVGHCDGAPPTCVP